MYELIDAIGTTCFIFVIVGFVIGVPVFIMEKLQEKTGFLNWWFKLLYGKNWEDVEDFEDEYDEPDTTERDMLI